MGWIEIQSQKTTIETLGIYYELPLELPKSSLIKIVVKHPKKWRRAGFLVQYSVKNGQEIGIFESHLYFNQPEIIETASRNPLPLTRLHLVPWLNKLDLTIYKYNA